MGIRVPRITLKADYGKSAFGELSLLSVGYGLHQAWIYAAMFGTSSIFGIQSLSGGLPGHSISLPFFVSIITFGLSLLVSAATDQKFLRFYVSRKVLTMGSIVTFLGTLLLIAPVDSNLGIAFEIIAGIMTGLGTAVLILFWGTSFARCDSASIVLNTAVAIVVAVGIYTIILHQVPFPVSGILTAVLPLGELFILLRKTPIPFDKRNELPIFNPLPVRRGKLLIKFGLPVFVFGIALGNLRHTSIQAIAPAATASEQILMLLAAGCATILILLTVLALGGTGQWNRFFRPLIPFIAVSAFFLPLSQTNELMFNSFFLLIGYMCFEALMWIFFGEVSQRFRLSPVFIFGLGRGLLALSSLIGFLIPIIGEQWISDLPFGENGMTIIILLIMVIAYSLLPHEREIEAIVIPCPLITAMSIESVTNLLNTPSTSKAPNKENPEDIATDILNAQDHNEVATPTVSYTTTPLPAKGGDTSTPADRHESVAVESPTSRKNNSGTSGNDQNTVSNKSGRFKAKCETIANTYLLSNRETEVMFLLAKGYNSAYIQEKLFISEGTAKTHIRHIYKKLNVHTQQELMKLVETIEIVDN